MDNGPTKAVVPSDADLQKRITVTKLQTVYSLTQYTEFGKALLEFQYIIRFKGTRLYLSSLTPGIKM